MLSILDTLVDRHKIHGSFERNARQSQDLKSIIHSSSYWYDLSTVQQEALDLIATKLSRILSTTGRHCDDWHDIAGYATLVEKWLRGEVL